MGALRFIKVFYIIYMLYLLLVIFSTDLTVYSVFPAIVLMWLSYIVFSFGGRIDIGSFKLKVSKEEGDKEPWLLKRGKLTLLLFGLLSIIFSLIATNYYTGQTPLSILQNFIEDSSLYYEYQAHFQNQQLSQLSLEKLPFILMLFYIKFILIYSYISFFIFKTSTTFYEKIYIFLITVPFIYFGIARGTNYELFELIIIIAFILFYRNKNRFPIKPIINLTILIIIMIFIFNMVVDARGVSNSYYISDDVYYDSGGYLPLLSENLSLLVLSIFSYFGFGFYYISEYVYEVWFSSMDSILAGFLPHGFMLFSNESIQGIMYGVVDIGARWHPDFIILNNRLGYLVFLFYCLLLGMITRFFQMSYLRNPITYITIYIIVLQMISLPIGNFVFVSSSNKLLIIFLLLYWVSKVFFRFKLK